MRFIALQIQSHGDDTDASGALRVKQPRIFVYAAYAAYLQHVKICMHDDDGAGSSGMTNTKW
jgi:hypothetical protein